eukprot:6188798-Pleurochrysis_carterae.AAC.1
MAARAAAAPGAAPRRACPACRAACAQRRAAKTARAPAPTVRVARGWKSGTPTRRRRNARGWLCAVRHRWREAARGHWRAQVKASGAHEDARLDAKLSGPRVRARRQHTSTQEDGTR